MNLLAVETATPACSVALSCEGVIHKRFEIAPRQHNRLPFAQPSDPLIQGRAHVINQNGGNFFKDVSLPEAVVLLRQGVGRLIRDENDYGVVMIGDQRIVTRNYGKVFLHSLPPMKRFNRVAPLRNYIAL